MVRRQGKYLVPLKDNKNFFRFKRNPKDEFLRILGIKCCHTCRNWNPKSGCVLNYFRMKEYDTKKTWEVCGLTREEFRIHLGCKCKEWE